MLQAQHDPLSFTQRVKTFLRRHVSADARGHARRWVLATPLLSDLYYLADPVARTMRLRRDTEVVIDGFPRSANTFAAESFRMANPECSIAHHLHDRTRIRRAVARRIPVILVIRQPDGCVNSFVNGIPGTEVDFFYAAYAKFYEGLIDDLSGMVIADFDEITTAWSNIVERVNKKFGTSYEAAGEDSHSTILRRVDDFGRSHAFGQATFDDAHFEMVVSRPSTSRTWVNVSELASPQTRQRALEAYARVIAARDAENSAN